MHLFVMHPTIMYISIVNRFQLISQPVSYAIEQNPIFPGAPGSFPGPFLWAQAHLAYPFKDDYRKGLVHRAHPGTARRYQPAPGDLIQCGQGFFLLQCRRPF